MITNPTQRQIDTKHNQDKVVVLNKSIKIKILEHIMDKLTGNKPSYVMYNGKQYESNELIIYSKEELASMHIVYSLLYFIGIARTFTFALPSSASTIVSLYPLGNNALLGCNVSDGYKGLFSTSTSINKFEIVV